MSADIPRWGAFESSLRASSPGNPSTDVSFGATSHHFRKVAP